MIQTTEEYVLEVRTDGTMTDRLNTIKSYAKLMNRAPKLEDFIPIGSDGNVLSEPTMWDVYCEFGEGVNCICSRKEITECRDYQKALSNVIFEGEWEVEEDSDNYIFLRDENLPLIQFRKHDKTFRGDYGTETTRIADLPREITFKDGVV